MKSWIHFVILAVVFVYLGFLHIRYVRELKQRKNENENIPRNGKKGEYNHGPSSAVSSRLVR